MRLLRGLVALAALSAGLVHVEVRAAGEDGGELAEQGTSGFEELTKEGIVEGVLSSSKDAHIFCFEGREPRHGGIVGLVEEFWQLPHVFFPVQTTITLHGAEEEQGEGKKKTSSSPRLQVRAMNSDDLHTKMDNFIQWKLGMAEREVAVLDRVTRGKSHSSFLPSAQDLVGKGVCPAPWSSEPFRCDTILPAYGHSCISVGLAGRGRLGLGAFKGESGAVAYTIETKHSFCGALFARMILGIVLLLFSYALSKSKIFQYATGASAGAVAGVVLIVLFVFRKKRGMNKFFAAGIASYSVASYMWLKYYLTQMISHHWEALLVCLCAGATVGVIVTNWLRKDDDVKHRAVVVVRWLLRGTGVPLVFTSLKSSFAQLLFLGCLLAAYIMYRVKKVARKKRDEKGAAGGGGGAAGKKKR